MSSIFFKMNKSKMRNTIGISIIVTLISVYLILMRQSYLSNYSHLTHHNTHISALILARGGSKGLKLKNIALIHNTTLLTRAIQTIKSFGLFDSLWVSTDNELIAKDAERNGANIHWREHYTATDEASSVTAVKEFIHNHPEIGIVALIQCTSPFLSVKYLTEAYLKIQDGYHSVFSVTRQHKLRWNVKDDLYSAENFDIYKRPRRQDWNGELFENGMFYFTYSQIVIEQNILQGGKIAVVEVEKHHSLEIDTKEDLKLAECMLSK